MWRFVTVKIGIPDMRFPDLADNILEFLSFSKNLLLTAAGQRLVNQSSSGLIAPKRPARLAPGHPPRADIHGHLPVEADPSQHRPPDLAGAVAACHYPPLGWRADD